MYINTNNMRVGKREAERQRERETHTQIQRERDREDKFRQLVPVQLGKQNSCIQISIYNKQTERANSFLIISNLILQLQ
jgi:hypothetical protein